MHIEYSYFLLIICRVCVNNVYWHFADGTIKDFCLITSKFKYLSLNVICFYNMGQLCCFAWSHKNNADGWMREIKGEEEKKATLLQMQKTIIIIYLSCCFIFFLAWSYPPLLLLRLLLSLNIRNRIKIFLEKEDDDDDDGE
jgi:uncharacterized membrane protein YjgN (DUF898 family)